MWALETVLSREEYHGNLKFQLHFNQLHFNGTSVSWTCSLSFVCNIVFTAVVRSANRNILKSMLLLLLLYTITDTVNLALY